MRPGLIGQGHPVYTCGMELQCDCHIHTLASGHAFSTVQECATAAAARGLSLIAITDHAPRMFGGPHLYYFHNLKVLPPVIAGIRVLKGVELNIIEPHGAVDLDLRELPYMDLAIASMHEPLFPKLSRAETTQALIKAMASPYVQIIGHPDDNRFPLELEEVARAAADTGVLLEVNNSSLRPTTFRLGARDNYRILLEACVRFGTRVIVNSDSHWHGDIGLFAEAFSVLEACGFPESLVANTTVDRLLSWLKPRQK